MDNPNTDGMARANRACAGENILLAATSLCLGSCYLESTTLAFNIPPIAEVAKIPQNTVAVTDPDTVLKIQKMLDLLEENDDVQNVFHNADLPEEEEED